MIPWPRLNTTAVTISQLPHSRNAARVRFVRGARRVMTSPATRNTSAAGKSHEIWAPKSALKRRSQPVAPQRLPAGATTADAPGFVAGQPAEAVVAEDQIPERVVLRAADVRTVRRGNELDRRHPPSGRDDHGRAARGELPDPPAQRRRSRDEIHEREAGHDEERLEHLGQEAEADERADEHEPSRPAVLQRATIAYAEPVSRSTSNASGLLKRNMSVATGVSARTAPATRPAPGENQRRTVAYSNPTAATPSSACGTRMLHELRPKTRADRSMTHRDAGALSVVMKFDASEEPKKNAFQLLEPACTAAE